VPIGPILCFDNVLYVHDNKVNGDGVLGAPRDDDIRELLGGDTELFEGGLDQAGVLVEHMVQITSSLLNVSEDTPGETGVCIGVDEQFHVEEISDLGVVEGEDTLEQDHIRGVDRRELVRDASIRLEVVDRYFGRSSFVYVVQARLHQGDVESVGVVEIKHPLLGAHDFRGREFAIEGVLGDVSHLAVSVLLLTLTQVLHDAFTY